MSRILVLGGNGQVGFELLGQLAASGPVLAATRDGRLPGGIACARCDLAVDGEAAALIARERPAVVVNAAAYTAVDRAEDEPELALRVNGLALAEIGEAARAVGAAVIHYSTDYVFPGDACRPCREDDATGPRSAYGESKLAGEQALAASGADHLVLRTAWVYGARGHNFLRTMLRLGAERDELHVVDDQHGAPTPAALIAAATVRLIDAWALADRQARAAGSGVYHLASAGDTTWCRFARAIFARAVAAGLLDRAPRVAAIASHEFPARAVRPSYSVLDSSRLRAAFGIDLPGWEAGLDRVVSEMAARA